MILPSHLLIKSRELAQLLLKQKRSVATAESCTGGFLSAVLTEVPGCSKWFKGGWITYSDGLKTSELEVDAAVLAEFGAVSGEVAEAMAQGALRRSQAQYSVALSGVAGPDGGTDEKPVGTVWIAVANANQVRAKHHLFAGDRCNIRQQAILQALLELYDLVIEAEV